LVERSVTGEAEMRSGITRAMVAREKNMVG
jgi:hypothetical protein